MQREEADPISSADASVLHALNTDVRAASLQLARGFGSTCTGFRFNLHGISVQLARGCDALAWTDGRSQFRDLFAMLVISSVNVDVQEAALVEVWAVLSLQLPCMIDLHRLTGGASRFSHSAMSETQWMKNINGVKYAAQVAKAHNSRLRLRVAGSVTEFP
jgi:hypothetical protein